MLRSFEARDRNLAELNCNRVSLFSIIIILTMVAVGTLQVYMIRSLFDTNPRRKKVWEKLENLIRN
jgi:p24 family protein gamma-2